MTVTVPQRLPKGCEAGAGARCCAARVRRDITINIGKSATVPQPGAPYEGYRWKEVRAAAKLVK